MMGRLARETDEGKKIAVVLDNARFHHAKTLNNLYAPGQALERITPIYMPVTLLVVLGPARDRASLGRHDGLPLSVDGPGGRESPAWAGGR